MTSWVSVTDGSWSSPAPGGASGASTPLEFASQGAKVVVNDLGGRGRRHRVARPARPARSSTRSAAWAARPWPTATTSPTTTAPGA